MDSPQITAKHGTGSLPDPHAFASPAEVAAFFNATGVLRGRSRLMKHHVWQPRAVHQLRRAMQADLMPVVRRRYIRPADAVAWLAANPQWKPFRIIPTPPNANTCPEAREWLKAGLTMKPFNL